MKNNSLNFFNYNAWANTRVFEHLTTLPEQVYTEKIKSVFPSVFDVLAHIYIIDRGWLAVLTKEYASDDYSTIKSTIEQLQQELNTATPGTLQEKYRSLSENMVAFIKTQNMDTVELFSGMPMSYADVFVHVVNHGTYHRGNISAMLHQLGHKSISTDYGFYFHTQMQK